MYRHYFDRSSSQFNSYSPLARAKEVKDLVLRYKHHNVIDKFVTYYLNRPSGHNLDFVHKKLAYAILILVEEILEHENNLNLHEARKLLRKIKDLDFPKYLDFENVNELGHRRIGSYILLLERVVEEIDEI